MCVCVCVYTRLLFLILGTKENMAKAKSPKLSLSFLSSFKICHPKNPPSMVKHPLTPINSKSFDISYPSHPDPPPSTPTNITPPHARIYPSRSCTTTQHNKEKLPNSPVSRDSEFDIARPIVPHSRAKEPTRFKRLDSREPRGGDLIMRESGRYHVRETKHGKVEQSFIVVKRSEDPYEDFKKSMLEMVVERQMFEANELEQLLMSFLSLNSRKHHKVIIEAFTEILKEAFCGQSK